MVSNHIRSLVRFALFSSLSSSLSGVNSFCRSCLQTGFRGVSLAMETVASFVWNGCGWQASRGISDRLGVVYAVDLLRLASSSDREVKCWRSGVKEDRKKSLERKFFKKNNRRRYNFKSLNFVTVFKSLVAHLDRQLKQGCLISTVL